MGSLARSKRREYRYNEARHCRLHRLGAFYVAHSDFPAMMGQFLNGTRMSNSRSECSGPACKQRQLSLPFRIRNSSPIRYVIAIVALALPASTITAVSCGLSCNSHCEASGKGTPCWTLPASDCSSSLSYCSVRAGCHCAGMSSANPTPVGCNVTACGVVADQSTCSRTTDCEWSDACEETVDCSKFDQVGCNSTDRCSWTKGC